MRERIESAMRLGLACVLWGFLGCAGAGPRNMERGDVWSESGGEVASSAALTLALGGDVMMGRWRGGEWAPYWNRRLLDEASEAWEGADVVVVNLESGLCSPREARLRLDQMRVVLSAPGESAEVLAEVGVDVVNLANNHAMDCGPEGMDASQRALGRVGVSAVGSAGEGPDVRLAVGDEELWVVGVTLHRPAIRPAAQGRWPRYVTRRRVQELVELVSQMRREDQEAWLMVSIHWGAEFRRRADAWQTGLARSLIEAGADVIHGHGSHTLQGVEVFRGGVIAYGLGNLHFDMRQPLTRERAIGWVECRRQPRGCRAKLRRLGVGRD